MATKRKTKKKVTRKKVSSRPKTSSRAKAGGIVVKKTASKPAPKTASGGSPAFALAKAMLEQDPKVEYAAVRAAADDKGLSMVPVVFGRAKKTLGLAKPAVKRPLRGRLAKEAAAARRPVGRPPGRRAAAASRAGDSIEGVIERVKAAKQERDRAMRVVSQIRDLLDSAL